MPKNKEITLLRLLFWLGATSYGLCIWGFAISRLEIFAWLMVPSIGFKLFSEYHLSKKLP